MNEVSSEIILFGYLRIPVIIIMDVTNSDNFCMISRPESKKREIKVVDFRWFLEVNNKKYHIIIKFASD